MKINIHTVTILLLLWLIFLHPAKCLQGDISFPPQQHVVLIIIDGARYSETLGDSAGRFIPRMKALAAQGTIAQNFRNDSITVTKRAIPAIWCGSWSVPKDTIVNGVANQYATAPTVWEYCRKDLGLDTSDVTYFNKSMPSPWLPSIYPGYGPAYWPLYLTQGATDLDVWQNARSAMERHHSRLSVIYLADVDSWGGTGNWAKYTRAITIADSIVGMAWDFLQADSIFQNTSTLFVTNDHGRHLDTVSTGFRSHGDGCEGCRHIMFLSIGPAVQRQTIDPIARIIPDITPTIGAILNFATPYATGSSMGELLSPIYSRQPETIGFGDMEIGNAKFDTLTLNNSGGVPLTIDALESSRPEIVRVTPVSAVIPPHDSRKFTVECLLTQPQILHETVVIRHNASSIPDTVSITGRVLQAGISIAPRALVFHETTVSDSSIDSILIVNTGTIPLNLTSVVSDNPQEFSLAPDSQRTILPGDHLPCFINFRPTQPGLQSANIMFTHNGPGSPDTLRVSGMGALMRLHVSLNNRWNMVSLPMRFQNTYKDSLFPTSISDAFAFDGNYSRQDVLQPHTGYWLKFSKTEDDTLAGIPIFKDTITVSEGWNLVGSITRPVAVSSIEYFPSDLLTNNWFGYSTGYLTVDTVRPGNGYWIKAKQGGTIILSSEPPLPPGIGGRSFRSSRVPYLTGREK